MYYIPFVKPWQISPLDMIHGLQRVSTAEPGHLLQHRAVPASSNVTVPLYQIHAALEHVPYNGQFLWGKIFTVFAD